MLKISDRCFCGIGKFPVPLDFWEYVLVEDWCLNIFGKNRGKQKQKQFEGKGNSWYVGIVSVELIVGIIMSNFQFTSLLRVV